jgi:ammonium transporter Rh
MTLIETFGYCINERISEEMGVADVGGSTVIHLYGAFFGLAVSKIVSPKDAFESKKTEPNYYSDYITMVGTVFLWMYWPSFNGALTENNSES